MPDGTHLELLPSCTPNGPNLPEAHPTRLAAAIHMRTSLWLGCSPSTPLPPLFELLNGRFSNVNSSTWYNVEFVVSREREQPSLDGGDFELSGEITLPARWPSEKVRTRDCLSIAEI